MRAPDGRFPTPEEHEGLVQQVIEIGRRVGTPTGIHVMQAQEAVERARQGMQFLAIGSDLRLMTDQAQEVLRQVRPQQAARDVARY